MTIQEQIKARAEKYAADTGGGNYMRHYESAAYTKGGEDMLPVIEDVGIQFSEFVAKGIDNRDFGFIPEWNRWRMYNVERITDRPTLWLPEQLYQHFLTNVYKPTNNE
jgi:hypothetical protein